jgi:RNA polymerase sigma-70 factor (ECF subfamily)
MKSSPSARRAEFEAVYESHSREIWAIAYARRLNAETALDIVQESFLRLWREWQKGVKVVNVRAWLMQVARNLAEDHAKSAFQRNGTQPPQFLNGLRSRETLPLDRLENEELFAQVRKSLNGLADADREILTLRYALEYETDQIAQALGVSANAVHMRLSRARQRLAEGLAAQGEITVP